MDVWESRDPQISLAMVKNILLFTYRYVIMLPIENTNT